MRAHTSDSDSGLCTFGSMQLAHENHRGLKNFSFVRLGLKICETNQYDGRQVHIILKFP